MTPSTHYIMRDQVRGLVATLSEPQPRPKRITLRSCFEITVFLLAVLSYVAALALAA